MKASLNEVFSLINEGKTFEVTCEEAGMKIKVSSYLPLIACAIHAGTGIRKDIQHKILLSPSEQFFEEDPATDVFVSGMPIVIEGIDSRYEYDLNRDPENAIYEEAWGKKVWKSLSKKDAKTSLAKHKKFYLIVDHLIKKINQSYKEILVIDMHSYNYLRKSKDAPLFNVGTENVNREKYGKVVDFWLDEMSNVALTDIHNLTTENGVFYGRGYMAKFCKENFDNVLVLATEVKKVYCNEETGEMYPEVINEITEGFQKLIPDTFQVFNQSFNPKKKVASLLKATDDSMVRKVDGSLHRALKKFELLNFINPINYNQEKKKFFQKKIKENPVFVYQPLVIDPYLLKRSLYNLPIEKVQDVQLMNIYKDVVGAYADKIDMLKTLGTEKFLYNVVRYFGEPSNKLIGLSKFILAFPENGVEEEAMPIKEALPHFKKFIENNNIKCKVELNSRLVAKAMVSNSKRTLYINPNGFITKSEIKRLIHHELGVHMYTTLNAAEQPLKLFSLGFPLNTETQEGLALYAEYCTGALTVTRLKELAIRVLAVESLLQENDFSKTFEMLTDECHLDRDKAFNLATRVYRGGGFTKDMLYLEGFRKILKVTQNGTLDPFLFTGKTSLDYLKDINDLSRKGWVKQPQYMDTIFDENPESLYNNEVKYLVSAIVNY